MEIQKCLRKIQNLLHMIREKIENLQDEEIEPYRVEFLKRINQIYMPSDSNFEGIRELIKNLLQLFAGIKQISREYIPRYIVHYKEDVMEIEFAFRKLGEVTRKLDIILKKRNLRA